MRGGPRRRLLVFAILWLASALLVRGSAPWTSVAYPDLRGPSVSECARRMPPVESQLYVCDPDNILNETQLLNLNRNLEHVAVGTPCHCQRRSQCSSGDSTASPFHGFIVSVALVNNLQMTIHSPSEKQLTDRAESFCRTLEGRWALGDCGNSVIVFVWQHYKKVIIWPARLAERYVTMDERKAILTRINHLIQTDQWFDALVQIVNDLHHELTGEPEDRFDTGTLSLLMAVGIAVLLTILITCCVCAFRCCGNLRNDSQENDEMYKSVQRMDSIRAQVVRRGSQLRRSLSRSPKFPMRDPRRPLGGLGFTLDADTTMV
ncbi:hypothetical protein QR680_012383 [Steinernema hermaphroditum]|uniref:Uncharacterized protein n=1 Tax=Steinernema hermaphroditum TaxID=289476 RepID=A0AA39I4L0_9BILA|nr:hypothetical protein QR680_012383 [Steinernema hermaphroditum]